MTTTAADEPTIAPAPAPVYPEPPVPWVAEQALLLLGRLEGATDAAEYDPFRITFAVDIVRKTFREALDQRNAAAKNGS